MHGQKSRNAPRIVCGTDAELLLCSVKMLHTADSEIGIRLTKWYDGFRNPCISCAGTPRWQTGEELLVPHCDTVVLFPYTSSNASIHAISLHPSAGT